MITERQAVFPRENSTPRFPICSSEPPLYRVHKVHIVFVFRTTYIFIDLNCSAPAIIILYLFVNNIYGSAVGKYYVSVYQSGRRVEEVHAGVANSLETLSGVIRLDVFICIPRR